MLRAVYRRESTRILNKLGDSNWSPAGFSQQMQDVLPTLKIDPLCMEAVT